MLLPLWLALQSLVEGETCPAAVDVEARVRSILHLAPERELTESFLIERHEAGLYVELRGADSRVIGQRTLPTQGSCDELAQAAAVVLSAWLSDVHPDFAGELPEPEPALPEPAPVSKPAEPPARAPVITPPAEPPRTSAAVARGWQLAAGIGPDLAGRSLELSFPVLARFGASASGFGATALGVLALPRRRPLGPGQVSWWRWPLGVGPSFRWVSSKLAFDAGAGGALAWFHTAGESFDHPSSHDGTTGGGYAFVGLSSRARAWNFFAIADAHYFPAATYVAVGGAVEAAWRVPRLNLGLALGVAFSP